jgi:hypothetical protein
MAYIRSKLAENLRRKGRSKSSRVRVQNVRGGEAIHVHLFLLRTWKLFKQNVLLKDVHSKLKSYAFATKPTYVDNHV